MNTKKTAIFFVLLLGAAVSASAAVAPDAPLDPGLLQAIAIKAVATNDSAGVDAHVSRWIDAIAHASPAGIGAGLQQMMAAANDTTRPALLTAVERAALAASNTAVCKALATAYVNAAVAAQDGRSIARLLEQGGARLRTLLPFDSAVWRLQAALLDLDGEGAKSALKRAVAADPAFEATDAYAAFLYQILQTRATAAPAQLDTNLEAVRLKLQRLAGDGDANAICRLIRDTLLERGTSVVASEDDNALCVGAKTAYRGLFAEYGTAYQAYLAAYLARLPADERPAFARRASLAPPPPVANAAGSSLPPLPAAAIPSPRFTALLDLPPGVWEDAGSAVRAAWGGRHDVVRMGLALQGDLCLIANSRMIAGLKDGALAWSRVLPATRLGIEGYPVQDVAIPAARLIPAVAGRTVAARLATPNAGFRLQGFDCATGAHRWTWGQGRDIALSDPAPWMNDRLVFLASATTPDTDATPPIDLVVIGAATGETLSRIPLNLGARWCPASPRRVGTWACAPTPAIDGNMAYVDTAAGMVGAVDLADESVLWLRGYPRRFDPEAGAMRLPPTPVLGARTALFAPFDSSGLLLVDRQSGKLLARRIDLAWTYAAPAGPETAAVLTRSAVHFLALGDLAAKSRFAMTDPVFVQSYLDGLAVADNSRLVVLDTRGQAASTTALPPGMLPLRATADRCYGLGGDAGLTFGWTAAAAPAPLVPAPPMPSAWDVIPAAWDTTAVGARGVGTSPAGGLVPDGETLTRLDEIGRTRWCAPGVGAETIALAGGLAGLVRLNQLCLYDDASGRLLAIWPPLAAETTLGSPLAVAASGNSLYVLVARGRQPRILRVQAQGGACTLLPVCDLAPVPPFYPDELKAPLKFYVADLPDRLVVLEERLWWTGLRYNVPKQSGKLVGDATEPERLHNPGSFFLGIDPGNRGGVALAGTQRKLWRFTTNRWEEVAFPEKMPSSWTRAERQGELVLLTTQQGLLYFDPKSMKCFAPGATRPLVMYAVGGTVLGAQGDGGAGTNAVIRPFRVDLRSVRTEPVFGTPVALPLDPTRARALCAFDLGASACLALLPDEYSAVGATRLLTWPRESANAAVSLFPYGMGLRSQPLSPTAFFVGRGVVTTQNLDRLTGLGRSVRKVSRAAEDDPLIDGFLDEWAPNEFMTTPRGRFAVRHWRAMLWIAAEVRDPAVMARVAAAGLDGHLSWVATPGFDAGFMTDGQPAVPQHLKSDEPPPPVPRTVRPHFAFSVTPDGELCRVEIVLQMGLPSDGRAVGQKPGDQESAFGDLALRLLWHGEPGEEPLNLLQPENRGPLSFERLLFE